MLPAQVRQHFSGHRFGAPCTPAQLARAESLLHQPIPRLLQQLYLDFDGFEGPTGAPFMWPLFEQSPGSVALVEMNLFFRRNDAFPNKLTSLCLFYGDSGLGSAWGFKADLPGRIILWDAEWGDDFEVVGDDMLNVWLEEKDRYDKLAPQ